MRAFQVKVAIKNSKPPIWRRVIIPAGMTFSQLGMVLHKAMGWRESYGFAFEFYHAKIHIADKAEGKQYDCLDASNTYVEEYLKENQWFTYTCICEEHWKHRVTMEQVLDDYPYDYPSVLKYKGECPGNRGNSFYDYDLESVNEQMCQEFSYVMACLRTCGMLHGITPMDMVLNMVNKHPSLHMSMEELGNYIEAIPTEFQEYVIKDGKLYYETLFPDDGGLIKAQGNKPFYIPAYQEICEFGIGGVNLKYREMAAFMKHLEEMMGADKGTVRTIAKLIQTRICNGCNYEEIFAILDEYGLMVSDEQELERLVDCVFELWHNTRMLFNRGYTPKEISALMKKEKSSPVRKENSERIKIYPNDPCPCGSGKKYKKCCGKTK